MDNRDWKTVNLSEIVDIKTGKLDSNAAIEGGEYPFFTCSPETLRINEFAFDSEAILLAGNNANGIFSIKHYTGKFNAYQRTYVITAKNLVTLDLQYLYYQLSTQLSLLQEFSVGSATKFLTIRILNPLPIPLPPLPEQRAIAGVLGALDDKIELNRRMNRTLEAMARAVFREWFVDNEDAKVWEVGRLGDFVEINRQSITKDYPHNEIEYIDISSVTVGHLEATNFFDLRDAPSRAKRLVQHGDTIWSTVRPNRKSYLFISTPKENLVVSTGFAVLTPVRVPPSFLYFYTTTDLFVDYLVSNADGSAYPAVLPERFNEAEFPIPPKNRLLEFERISGPLLAKIACNEKESRTLASMRDTLLPKLMCGEVRVKHQP